MYDNAIACCKKIRRYAPDDPKVGALLARYYASKGLRADASRELEAHADRMDRSGQPAEAIAALGELLILTPENTLQREKLARLYAENGQRDAAVEEYRRARIDYEARGDQDGVARVGDCLAEHGDRPKPLPREREEPAAPAPDPSLPGLVADVDHVLDDGSAVEEAAPSEAPPIPLGLEIERTSYSDREHVADQPEPGASGSASMTAYAEMIDRAERAASEGDAERAAAYLLEAAQGFASQRRWEEAVATYRRLAALGRARDEDYAAWTEAARQAGMASLVLEALASQAQWHVQAGRRSSARRAAEEMLLVDPQNQLATEILSKVGSTLPRD